MSEDDLCEEDVAEQIEAVLLQLGVGVRRLGNYLLLDIPGGTPEGQAFTVIVNEICK